MSNEDFVGCHDGTGDDDVCLGIRVGRKQGALEELKDLKNKINEDEINNIVWKEGAQYFETILDLIEERIKDLEGKE